MSPTLIAALVVAVVLLLGTVVFPAVNKRQFRKLPEEQKIRILMKQANKLLFFKNVSEGRTGTLYFVKNKRKIYCFPWKLKDGAMVCTRELLFDRWDYPEEQPAFTEEEIAQITEELKNYNRNNAVKLVTDNEFTD